MGPVSRGAFFCVLADIHRIPISRSTWRPGARSRRFRVAGEMVVQQQQTWRKTPKNWDQLRIYG